MTDKHDVLTRLFGRKVTGNRGIFLGKREPDLFLLCESSQVSMYLHPSSARILYLLASFTSLNPLSACVFHQLASFICLYPLSAACILYLLVSFIWLYFYPLFAAWQCLYPLSACIPCIPYLLDPCCLYPLSVCIPCMPYLLDPLSACIPFLLVYLICLYLNSIKGSFNQSILNLICHIFASQEPTLGERKHGQHQHQQQHPRPQSGDLLWTASAI